MRLSLLSLAAAYAFVAPNTRHAHAPRRALNTDEATPPPPSKAKLRRMSRSLYVRGERRLGSGRYKDAADLFSECVALTPKDSYAWRALATARANAYFRAAQSYHRVAVRWYAAVARCVGALDAAMWGSTAVAFVLANFMTIQVREAGVAIAWEPA